MTTQFTIIDGYNALHCCGFIRSGVGPGTLQRARAKFVGFLLRNMNEAQRRRTTIVFDSSEHGHNSQTTVGEIHIEFAVDYESADQCIEYLIKRHSAAKKLTVVSSDHRLQQAASRRGAKFVDSEVWFDELISNRIVVETESETDSREPLNKEKMEGRLDEREVQSWLQEWDISNNPIDSETTEPPDQSKSKNPRQSGAGSPPRDDQDSGWSDVFPPGYTDDLFDDE